MRSRSGDFLFALHFPISATSAFEAEFFAHYKSVSWAIDNGYQSFEPESDSHEVMKAIEDTNLAGRWKKMALELRRWMAENGISFRHVLRDVNWPAHFMSILYSNDFIIFDSIRQVPVNIRRSLLIDQLGLSYFRICLFSPVNLGKL
ncbi:unnamed protein product [Cuscuta europaea]|uniref:RNase H type-1 domain-containing protein n=1 Tax=Cuscuta europaea TaxID=41803 RepID=A0A9P1E774_CUSEU|nr:unnamed protein product [Cuscuta europaea]